MDNVGLERVINWLYIERDTYQVKKFDYEEQDPNEPVEHWMQQFASYEQRIPIFGMDTPQGFQAALKLAATAVALCEHLANKHPELMPKPGVSSGTIEPWQ
jgi:hypothetical protein